MPLRAAFRSDSGPCMVTVAVVAGNRDVCVGIQRERAMRDRLVTFSTGLGSAAEAERSVTEIKLLLPEEKVSDVFWFTFWVEGTVMIGARTWIFVTVKITLVSV